MGAVAEAIAAESNVLRAWNTTAARLDDAGVVVAEYDEFRAKLLDNLARVARQLRSGSWEPSALRRTIIPKSDGAPRVLHIPPVFDRVCERAVLQVIGPLIDPHLQPDSYGARPGLGVDDAIRAVAEHISDGQAWMARADVADCFATLSQSDVCRGFEQHVREERVLRMVKRALTRDIGAGPGIGIAQGSPLSPLAANVALDQLDRAMWNAGFPIVRYIDDICIACASEAEAYRGLQTLQREAARMGLSLSSSKSHVGHVCACVSFLGETLDGRERSARSVVPQRSSIYVMQRGSAVRARGSRFVVSAPGQTAFRHPAGRTRMIVCGPRTMLSTAVLALAHEHQVDVAITDPYRGITGFFTAAEPRGRHIAAQHAAAADDDRRIGIARCFVEGKISNSRVLLTRTKRRRELIDPAAVNSIVAIQQNVHQAKTTAELIGYEGAVARIYFDAWKSLIGREWKFTGRNRRPPRDPVNAMLSYGYTLLAAEVLRAVSLAGFDPYCGLLHSSGRNRPSLVCDLMEEFRPLIIDSVVLRLLAVGSVTTDDFQAGSGGCRMSLRARRVLVEAIEERMLVRLTHPITRKAMVYRECIEAQAALLARRLLTPTDLYHPFPWR